MPTLDPSFMPDWPVEGDIDLNIHDLPHKSSTTEWWYMHSHLTAEGNRNLALFAAFFRRAISLDKSKGEYNYAHSVLWALSDLDKKEYHTVSLVDHRAPKIGLKKFGRKDDNRDPFIRKATVEILRKGIVPYPDKLLTKNPSIPWTSLHLNYDGQIYKKNSDNTYQLQLHDKDHDLKIDLNFKPMLKPIRHGENGVILNSAVEDMFYYFIPKCEVTGKIHLRKEKLKLISGSGWYDHEFGARPKSKSMTKKEVAWNWIGIQLDNGFEFTVYDVHTRKTIKDKNAYLIMIDPEGVKHKTRDFSFDAYGPRWTSSRTFNTFPTSWRIKSKAFALDLDIQAAFENQEFATILSRPAFWEGRLDITGTHRSEHVTGKAYLERHGHVNTETLPEFLKAVSKTTLASVKKILPLHPKQEKFEELVSKKGNKNFVKNLDIEIVKKKLIAPIREITDRGGKSWRSYATVACCDAVGGNSQKVIDWLALPELLHVGSLMVDDVQDKSFVRRGGPAAHLIHGEAIAINSGTAAYFIGQCCIYHEPQSDRVKIQIYNWYFEAMRAAHSGQALDVFGLAYMMPRALKEDNFARLLPKRVLSIHRLKSAAPSSYLAKIGALLGHGSQNQIEALGTFFEALGISFQIIDDTLNLKGFRNNLKTKAEDLSEGKITYPVALTLSVMPKKDRAILWNIVKSKTKDFHQLTKALALIEKYNGIVLSEQYAKRTLERAWKKLDPLLKDSMIKINLRAFSWYVLERTY